MFKYLTYIFIALSGIGLSHLYSQNDETVHLKDAVNTYKKFLVAPQSTDLEATFLPIDQQRNMFSGYHANNQFEELMMHFIDVDFNESLRDIKNDFKINMNSCKSTFTNNINERNMVNFYKKFDIEVVYHEIACSAFTLESFVFLKKIQGGEYKTYKVTFSAKR